MQKKRGPPEIQVFSSSVEWRIRYRWDNTIQLALSCRELIGLHPGILICQFSTLETLFTALGTWKKIDFSFSLFEIPKKTTFQKNILVSKNSWEISFNIACYDTIWFSIKLAHLTINFGDLENAYWKNVNYVTDISWATGYKYKKLSLFIMFNTLPSMYVWRLNINFGMIFTYFYAVSINLKCPEMLCKLRHICFS